MYVYIARIYEYNVFGLHIEQVKRAILVDNTSVLFVDKRPFSALTVCMWFLTMSRRQLSIHVCNTALVNTRSWSQWSGSGRQSGIGERRCLTFSSSARFERTEFAHLVRPVS